MENELAAARGKRSLSEVPADVIAEKILIHLRTRDAVRTSILSRSWRNIWKLTPDIDLGSNSSPEIVHKVLHSHSAPIRLFKLSFDGHWVLETLAALSSSSSSISLHTLALIYQQDSHSAVEEHYIISIAVNFPNLNFLKLSKCCPLSPPPDSCTFASLRTLEINWYYASKGEGEISKLISACPLLEDLSLLSVLMVHLDVIAPNLRRLKLITFFAGSFSITHAPLLQEGNFKCLLTADADCRFIKVLGSTPSIKRLRLSSHLLQHFGVYSYELEKKNLSLLLENLKFIQLDSCLYTTRALRGLFLLLRSSRNLEELHISGSLAPTNVCAQVSCKGQKETNVLDKLIKLVFNRLSGMEQELDFIQFVLATSEALQEIDIHITSSVEDKESLKAKILKFPRVSKQAQIAFTGIP